MTFAISFAKYLKFLTDAGHDENVACFGVGKAA